MDDPPHKPRSDLTKAFAERPLTMTFRRAEHEVKVRRFGVGGTRWAPIADGPVVINGVIINPYK